MSEPPEARQSRSRRNDAKMEDPCTNKRFRTLKDVWFNRQRVLVRYYNQLKSMSYTSIIFANTWPQFLVSVNNEACLLIPFSRCPPPCLSPPLSLSFSTSEVLLSVSSLNAPQNSYMFSFSPPADGFLTSLFILLLERATIRVLLKITGRLRRSIIVKPAVSYRRDAATSHAPSTFPPYAVSPTALSCITATQSNTSLYGVPRKWSSNRRKGTDSTWKNKSKP